MSGQSKIILVGNGPSIMNHEFGEVIDSYDLVVRFNWYHIKGYEKQVGTKTDIWFTTIFCPQRIKKDYVQIYEHSWEWDHMKDKTFNKIQQHRNDTVLKVSKSNIPQMHQIAQDRPLTSLAEKNYHTFSTGAIAVNIFKLKYGTIDIVGFDWWDLGSTDKHHYGDNQTLGRIHKPDVEFSYFKNLVDADVVTDLNPESKLNLPDIPKYKGHEANMESGRLGAVDFDALPTPSDIIKKYDHKFDDEHNLRE